MAVVGRNILKSFFTPGSIPTSLQFNTLIDSSVNVSEDRNLLGLRNFDPALIYVAGDCAIHDTIIYQATATTVPGPFDPGSWKKLAGGLPGSVTYKGTWDANANDPDLETIGKSTGDYYVVSVEGDTVLNTPPNEISDWQVGDWAIYNGTLWEKVDNSDAVTGAANVDGAGAGLFKGKNLTILEFKRITTTDGSLLVNEGTNAVDLNIQFDNAGTANNRTWSASKINTELSAKQPLLGYTAEDEANKITAFTGTPGDVEYPSAKLVYDQLEQKQDVLGYTAEDEANKISAFTGTPDDVEYPSAKLVYDQLALKQDDLGYTAENSANKVIAFQSTPDNIHYPSEKLVADQLALKQNFLGYTAENSANRVIAFQSTPDNIHYPSEKLVADQLALKQNFLGYTAENAANRVSAFQSTPDNIHYPSEKLVADQLALKQNFLGYTAENTANRVSAFQSTPDNIHYPSEKLVADQLALKQNNLGYTAENSANKVIAFQSTPDNIHYPSEKLVADQLALKQNNLGYTAENSANKVIAFQSTPDNIHYPSEKLVADQLALKQNLLGYEAENLANKVTAFQATPDNIHYPSEKLVADQLKLKQNALGYTAENAANKVTAFQATPDNAHYPSEKLVADKFATFSNVQNTKVNLAATVDPAAANDNTQGYSIGSRWINTLTQKEYVCVNAATGAAIWKTTTVTLSVFGNDYTAQESAVSASTSSTTFQSYSVTGASILKISTGALSGTYRIQWSCLASNNGQPGEFRLAEVSGTATAIGQTQVLQAAGTSVRANLVGTSNVVLTGTNKDYVIQFRAQTTLLNTQSVYGGRLEIFRIS